LKAKTFHEGGLHGMELFSICHAFNGLNRLTFDLDGKNRARLHRLAIQQNRASTTLRRVAANVSARKARPLSNEMNQQCARFDARSHLSSIYIDRNRLH
jgi:hypothetical protein